MAEQQRANNNNNILTEWEAGLPNADDLTPLSQTLIPPELASAFSITPEPHRTNLDVNRASQSTLSSIIGGDSTSANFKSFNEQQEEEEEGGGGERKIRRMGDNNNNTNSNSNNKRARLVWTPQLHKRFVEVVAHLGIKSAVPKTIMQMMNVEGLTRENVASHLQKYRLYLKRMQGLSNDGPTASDRLFASTPVPNCLRESTNNSCGGGGGDTAGITNNNHHLYHPVYGMMGHSYSGFDYNGMMGQHQHQQQQRDCGNGSKFGSVNSYQNHRISPGGDN